LACVSVLDILTLHSYSSNFLFLFSLLLTPPQFSFRHFGLFRALARVLRICYVLPGCGRCAAYFGHGFAVPGGGCTPGTPQESP
jgi:hypothetical protein